ncbi:hypothetical protein AB0M46_28100 [Dactylosporangium sp. NPDC051485]|uniref:hypothetical protein n=1 Tax=Dactylosporangium sp. NPDC051485 TaxID=3154846 RepID=UPI003431B558
MYRYNSCMVITKTDAARPPIGFVLRIRHRLWLRVLIGLSAVALYASIAFVLVGVTPDAAWPAIGDAGYSSGQATVVPAMNVFALGVILLAVFEPAAPFTVRMVLGFPLAILAAVAGPLLAVLGGADAAAGLLARGVMALAVAGIIVGVARTWVTRRLAPPPR